MKKLAFLLVPLMLTSCSMGPSFSEEFKTVASFGIYNDGPYEIGEYRGIRTKISVSKETDYCATYNVSGYLTDSQGYAINGKDTISIELYSKKYTKEYERREFIYFYHVEREGGSFKYYGFAQFDETTDEFVFSYIAENNKDTNHITSGEDYEDLKGRFEHFVGAGIEGLNQSIGNLVHKEYRFLDIYKENRSYILGQKSDKSNENPFFN